MTLNRQRRPDGQPMPKITRHEWRVHEKAEWLWAQRLLTDAEFSNVQRRLAKQMKDRKR